MENGGAGAGEKVSVEMLEEFRVVQLEVGELRVVGEVNGCGWCGLLDDVGGSTKSLKATTCFLSFPFPVPILRVCTRQFLVLFGCSSLSSELQSCHTRARSSQIPARTSS